MNRQKLMGRLDRTKGFARELWGELSGDELHFYAGQRDRMIGRLEEKYNMSRNEAEIQVEEHGRKLFPPDGTKKLH